MLSCSFEADGWAHDVAGMGSSSSPAATDLNGDGVLDVVLGGGAKEFQALPSAVVAVDGKTGEELWRYPGRNQMVGSPVFRDLNGDGSEDVFIGGRSGMLLALDGRAGTLLWEFHKEDPNIRYFEDTSVLNFFNLQWTPDLDGDDFPDLLSAYGGYVKAKAGDPNRPAGYLLVVSGKTGKTIAKARVPDGKETYMSPLLADFGKGLEVVFGTGGEDISGKLYRVALADVLAADLSAATVLLEGGEKGFIAPPVLTDVNGDGTEDITISTVDGRLYCLDGKSGKALWEARPEGDYDTYTAPAPGYFTDDETVDFFASFGHGPWPTADYTIHTLVDGKTGEILFLDTLGTFQYASPVVTDFDGDGRHDVMLAINYKTSQDVLGEATDFYSNGLFVYSAGRGDPLQAFPSPLGTNLGSTPLVTDLDADGKLDIVTAYMSDPQNFYSFRNLKIERQEVNRSSGGIFYGQYMGPGGRGRPTDQ